MVVVCSRETHYLVLFCSGGIISTDLRLIYTCNRFGILQTYKGVGPVILITTNEIRREKDLL